MEVPGAQIGSWEYILHNSEPINKIILLKELQNISEYSKYIGHRAIGVIYNPKSETGNYVPSILPKRYNAFIFIDRTNNLETISKDDNLRLGYNLSTFIKE
jgi:erythromycin esterase